jgi:hypothetical protein
MRFLIIFFLLTSVCWAKDIPLTSTFTLKKKDIAEDKILNENERIEVEKTLKEQGRKLIHKELKPLKNDYQNDFDRGTVEYTPKCRNYSYHKVIISDGIIIRDTNFTQKAPHTKAIEGKNLTFIDCNLINVETDPTWTIQGCNNAQIKRIKKSEKDLGNGMKEIIISNQIQEDKLNGKFVEVGEDVETTNDLDSYNLVILRLNK